MKRLRLFSQASALLSAVNNGTDLLKGKLSLEVMRNRHGYMLVLHS